jgi:biopolymer transport protein ExbB
MSGPATSGWTPGSFLQEAVEIWISGGWAMIAIAVVALLIFGTATHIHLRLRELGFDRVPPRRWRAWIRRPQDGEGRVGTLIRGLSVHRTPEAVGAFFERLQATEVAPFQRDLRILKACVAAAPLLGLLGTVIGMLTTFAALSTGSGGDKTMAAVAGGISEALITTETGLVIALPGLFLQYRLARGVERYRAFLAALETGCAQHRYALVHPAPAPA